MSNQEFKKEIVYVVTDCGCLTTGHSDNKGLDDHRYPLLIYKDKNHADINQLPILGGVMESVLIKKEEFESLTYNKIVIAVKNYLTMKYCAGKNEVNIQNMLLWLNQFSSGEETDEQG